MIWFHDIFNFTRYILDLGEPIIICTEIPRHQLTYAIPPWAHPSWGCNDEVHGLRVYQAKSEGPKMNGICNTDAHDLSSLYVPIWHIKKNVLWVVWPTRHWSIGRGGLSALQTQSNDQAAVCVSQRGSENSSQTYNYSHLNNFYQIPSIIRWYNIVQSKMKHRWLLFWVCCLISQHIRSLLWKALTKLKHQSNPQGQKITEGAVMPLSLMLD